jgi:hypothetical protein
MSGESSGAASAVPAEPSNNMLVSSTHLFRMIYSTWSQYPQPDYSMVVAHEGNFYVRAADRAELPVSATVVCRRVVMAR